MDYRVGLVLHLLPSEKPMSLGDLMLSYDAQEWEDLTWDVLEEFCRTALYSGLAEIDEKGRLKITSEGMALLAIYPERADLNDLRQALAERQRAGDEAPIPFSEADMRRSARLNSAMGVGYGVLFIGGLAILLAGISWLISRFQ